MATRLLIQQIQALLVLCLRRVSGLVLHMQVFLGYQSLVETLRMHIYKLQALRSIILSVDLNLELIMFKELP